MLNFLMFDPAVAVGFVFILAVAWQWFAVPADARRNEYLLLIGIFGAIADPVTQAVANSLSRLRPMKMDLYAYALDRHLGEPAFVLGRMVNAACVGKGAAECGVWAAADGGGVCARVAHSAK